MGLRRSFAKVEKRRKAVNEFLKWRKEQNFKEIKEYVIFSNAFNKGWKEAIKWLKRKYDLIPKKKIIVKSKELIENETKI